MKTGVILILSLVCTTCWAGVGGAAGGRGPGVSAGPRFIFRPGEVLAYRWEEKGPEVEGVYRGKGTLTVRTLAVTTGGIGKIEVSAQGAGRIFTGGRWAPLSPGSTPPVIALVKSDGTITQLQDDKGQQLTFVGMISRVVGAQGMNAGAGGVVPALGMYRLLGLQLPARIPAAGGTYPGFAYLEHIKTSVVGGETRDTVSLEVQPATFTFLGSTSRRGTACLAFLCPAATLRLEPRQVAVKVCFDPTGGRVVAYEGESGGTATSMELEAVRRAP